MAMLVVGSGLVSSAFVACDTDSSEEQSPDAGAGEPGAGAGGPDAEAGDPLEAGAGAPDADAVEPDASMGEPDAEAGELMDAGLEEPDAGTGEPDAGAVPLLAIQFGGASDDFGSGIAVDAQGNVVVVGSTFGTLEGDRIGAQDAFVRKYSATGELLWSRQFGTVAIDRCSGVAIDASGNVVVVGTTFGALVGTSYGESDGFARKYSANGTLVWTRQWGGEGIDSARGVAIDSADNIVVVGDSQISEFGRAPVDFDATIHKLSADGAQLWRRSFGGFELEDSASAIVVDATDHVLVAGTTKSVLGTAHQGDHDAFVRKYSTSGAIVWTQQFGTAAADLGRGLAVDLAGNVLVVGTTLGGLEGASAGAYDSFVRKLSADGEPLWTRQFGTASSDEASDVAIDGQGNVLVAGVTDGVLGAANAGDVDAFVRKLSTTGELLWTQQFGTEVRDSASDLVVDSAGRVLVVGTTRGALAAENAGMFDVFVKQLAP